MTHIVRIRFVAKAVLWGVGGAMVLFVVLLAAAVD